VTRNAVGRLSDYFHDRGVPFPGLNLNLAVEGAVGVNLHVGRSTPSRRADMIGRRFGRLLVLKHVPAIDRYARFKCACDCGAHCEARGSHLRAAGHTTSCGCGRQAFTETGAQMAVPMIGKRFGMLTVIARAGSSQLCNDQSLAMWRAVCDCGNVKDVAGHHLRRGSVKSCGCLRRELGKAKLAARRGRTSPRARPTWNLG
jgi:hypothetical protein